MRDALTTYEPEAQSGMLATRAQAQAVDLVRYEMAKRYRRDPVRARDVILNTFTRARLAEVSKYEYAKGGTRIDGPSIRAAEALALGWGNIGFGYEVVNEYTGGDGIGVSEVRAWAVDYESGVPAEIKFPVRHVRVTREGEKPLKDDREKYEQVANLAARRKRACILAVIPQDIVDDAMDQVEVTLRAKADTSPEAMQKMLAMFADHGVTREQIEARIQRSLDAISAAQVVSLRKIYMSLRDGMSRPAQWFQAAESDDPDADPFPAPQTGLGAVKSALGRGKPRPAPAPAPAADDGPPAMDVAALLKAIRAAQSLDDLEVLADLTRHTDDTDRLMLSEALEYRQQQLTRGNEDGNSE